jgi:transcriptional regulator with XRE-family HTH domain
MNEPNDAYPGGSIINLIAHQNLLSLRQKSADAYFDEKAKERLIASKDYKQTRIASTQHGEGKIRRTRKSKHTWAVPDSKIEIPLVAIEELKKEMITEFMSMGKVSDRWLAPEGLDEKVHPPKSREDFARHAGIDEGHYVQVEKGEVQITLDDAIKICRAYNIDMAKFLTPPLENLEKDSYFDLLPIHPQAGPTYMYQWIMWIHGYKELPGQDPIKFREATALPTPYNYAFHGGRERDYEVRQKELEQISKSRFNASELLVEPILITKNDIPRTPYEKIVSKTSFDKQYGHSLVKSTRKIATSMKVVFRTDNGKMGVRRLRSRFTDAFGVLRENVVYVVRIMLGLNK